MNYKKQSATLLILALGLGLQACSKEEVEVVTFNPTYSLDPNAIWVDTPAEYKYNENNIIRYNGESELVFSARLAEGGGTPTMVNNQVTLNFALRRAFTQDTDFVLVEDRSLLDNYNGVKEGFAPMPEGVVAPLRFTMPKGQVNTSATISITNLDRFTATPGYLTAFRIRPADEKAAIQFSQEKNILIVKVKVANPGFIGDANNGQLQSSKDASWTKKAANLFTASSSSTRALNILFDGQNNSLWYEGAPHNIDLTLNDVTKVNGLGFFVSPSYVSSYPIKTVTVKAQEDDSDEWVSQGQFTITNPQEFYIKFKQAIDAKKIRLEIAGNSGTYWVLSELELY